MVWDALKAAVSSNMKVRRILSDFEKAEWKSAMIAFPDIMVVGCLFHFSQAIWKKVNK